MVFAGMISVSAHGEVVTINPDRDSTLFSQSGSIANGMGEYLFVGTTMSGQNRRSLLHFDVGDDIPAGASVTDVTLTLNLSKSRGLPVPVDIHDLLADWGEGNSNAFGNEGGGTTAQSGDATWTHRFFNTETWSTPGGDFASTVLASSDVTTSASSQQFNTPGLVNSVQSWVDDPGSNFGWMLISPDTEIGNALRFDSTQSNISANRPILTIEYEIVTDPKDLNGDMVFNAADVNALYMAINTMSGDLLFDLNSDNQINESDLDFLIVELAETAFGDATLDQVVNLEDLAKLATNFGQSVNDWGAGDFNNDGIVNLEDLARLATNFGFDNRGSDASAISVPTPNTLVLLLVGFIGYRKRQCSSFL